MQDTNLSYQQLLERINQLNDENEALKSDRSDLEIMVETITEHSTNLENEIYEKNQIMLKYIQQVEKITTAAAAVEKNAFETHILDEVATREDELGQLARVFQNMASQVKTREETLKKQVEELRIEIDKTRQAQQVAEIVGTDSFKKLKDKLKKMKSSRLHP